MHPSCDALEFVLCRYKKDEDRELANAQATRGDAAAAQGADATDEYELRGLFWMSPVQLEQARRHHHLLIHDNTYTSNLFGMPLGLFTSVNQHGHTIVTAQCVVKGEKTEEYEWAFNAYLRAVAVAPRVFMTDRDQAVEGATKSCFPSTTKHLW